MTVETFIPAAPDQTGTQPARPAAPAHPDAKRLYIQTQGCQMNVYDSDRMADLLGESHGFVLTDNPEDADVLLMNTCSIREKAQEKVFSELGRWRQLKQKNPAVVIGVGGCVASQEGAALQDRAPYVDLVFGPQTLHRLPDLLDQHHTSKATGQKIRLVDISFPEIEKFDYLPEPRVEGHKAFVSIMEGCSKYCAFCVVPYTRGEEVSRPLDDVLAEISSLASRGVREITLLGQNVNGYRGPTFEGGLCDFADLLTLVHGIEGVERIRYTTSHPLEFSDKLIERYRELPKLVSHLHLPVQSGSNAVLAGMKRNHSIDVYVDKIQRLRQIRPDLHLSSDFIIGFPGEGEAEFAETFAFIQALDFDHSYSFVYSKRPGTPAAELPDDTPEGVKKARLALIQDWIRDSTRRKTAAMVGHTHRVLVEGRSERRPDLLVGSADNTRMIQFAGDPALIGSMVWVKVTSMLSMNLLDGVLTDAPTH
jgi:tRNA-2-methylthio-N6-dimethylallyladenosine synthase